MEQTHFVMQLFVLYVCIYVCACMNVCMRVCVCVCERETQTLLYIYFAECFCMLCTPTVGLLVPFLIWIIRWVFCCIKSPVSMHFLVVLLILDIH